MEEPRVLGEINGDHVGRECKAKMFEREVPSFGECPEGDGKENFLESMSMSNDAFESSCDMIEQSTARATESHPIFIRIRERLESQRNDIGQSPAAGRRKRLSVNLVREQMVDELLKLVEDLELDTSSNITKIQKLKTKLDVQNEIMAHEFAKTDTLNDQVQILRESLDTARRLQATSELQNLSLKAQLAKSEHRAQMLEAEIMEVKFDKNRSRLHRSNSYTKTVPLQKRMDESTDLYKRYPSCVPIILEPPVTGSAMARTMGFNEKQFKRKILLSGDIDFQKCCIMLRQHLEQSKSIDPINAKNALYFFINQDFSTALMNQKLSHIYQMHRHADGFLYVNFAAEATFG